MQTGGGEVYSLHAAEIIAAGFGALAPPLGSFAGSQLRARGFPAFFVAMGL